jgi:hypothetical protein
MSHPFEMNLSDLEALDLEFEEKLTNQEAATIGGGSDFTTLALGEEGGDGWQPIKPPRFWSPPIKIPPCHKPPVKPPCQPPIDPPIYTTLALGEEGGDFYQ